MFNDGLFYVFGYDWPAWFGVLCYVVGCGWLVKGLVEVFKRLK